MNLARRAVRLYPRTDYADKSAVNHLRRAWIKSVAHLGDKWLMATANRVQRKADAAVLCACLISALPWEML